MKQTTRVLDLILKSQGGFSLAEMVVATAIIAVVLGAFGTFTAQMYGAKSDQAARQEFNGIVNDVILALKGGGCRLNFANIPLEKDKVVKDLVIRGRDNKEVAQKGLIGPNRMVELTDVELKTQEAMGATRWMASVHVKAKRYVHDTQKAERDNRPAMNLNQTIPILATTNDISQLLDCHNSGTSGGSNLRQQACALKEDGSYYWDNASKKCKSRYKTVCFKGDRFTATCGDGAIKLLPTIRNSCRSGLQDTDATQIPRTYEDGRVRYSKLPRTFQCTPTGPLSVNCTYASDLDSSGAICEACCQVDALASLDGEELEEAQIVDDDP